MLWYFISTGLSTCALLVSVIAITRPQQKVRHVVQQYHDIDQRLDTLEGRIKKLNANHALLLARERGADTVAWEDSDTKQRPGETPQQWKDRMRAALRSGKLKIGGTD
jgi:hypothetical protein